MTLLNDVNSFNYDLASQYISGASQAARLDKMAEFDGDIESMPANLIAEMDALKFLMPSVYWVIHDLNEIELDVVKNTKNASEQLKLMTEKVDNIRGLTIEWREQNEID